MEEECRSADPGVEAVVGWWPPAPLLWLPKRRLSVKNNFLLDKISVKNFLSFLKWHLYGGQKVAP